MHLLNHSAAFNAFPFAWIVQKVHTYTPLNANTLVLVTLRGDHDVCLVQYEHFNFLRVDEFELLAPVQHRTGGADHNLLLELHPSLHWTKQKSAV